MRIEGVDQGYTPSLQPQKGERGGGFGEMVASLLAETNSQLHRGAEAQEALLEGKVENMTELMVTIEKADIALRMTTEIRNKAVEAYQEIIRMQI
ncbi:MAG: flagellar hook-basal body complex protein FliE [Epsilonproteobacteria bacterium]|nr:flagellar hook-basal body complex protein FliE [Campylobacterota bacterium]NPA56898.1 flagellar hook-basal body complex protein FliE [Campylobacterota bacterium]